MADVARFDRLAAVHGRFAGATPRPDVASGFVYALVGMAPTERAERGSREGRERGEPVRG